MKTVIVTTSWDDGHKLDEKLGKLLRRYDISGTFYISPKDREFDAKDLLTEAQIRQLAANFEIGAHTMTHPRLTSITDDEARKEILSSKKYLEKVTGKSVTTFCYPGGEYLPKHAQLVKSLGFKYARTVKRHSFSLTGSTYEAQTTVNVYNHYQDIWKILVFARFNLIKAFQYRDWEVLAKAMFDYVLKNGGIYHLWGHSWEIEKHNDWTRLENIFRYISRNKKARYLQNGEVATFQEKNLLMVAPYFPPHVGGQEFYCMNIARHLQKQGWNITVATSAPRILKPRSYIEQGIKIYELPYLFKLSNTPINPFWPRQLRRIIRRDSINIINAHAPVVFMAEAAERAAGKLPLVLTYHMLSMKKNVARYDLLINTYEKYILPKTLKKATHIIYSSRAVQKFFHIDNKNSVISPGVDTERFIPANHPSFNSQTLLFNGSLQKNSPHKGLKVLLDALVIIVKKYPGIKLQVIGQGNATENYRILAQDLGLGQNVAFSGLIFDDELVRAYQAATIFVQPSLNDNYPLAVLEALSCGIPVVASDVGAIPLQIDDSCGVSVPPGDSAQLAAEICRLLENPKLLAKMAVSARDRVMNLDWSVKAKQTSDVLMNELNGGTL